MIGPSYALHEAFDVFGGTDLNYQVDVPPVDTEVKRSCTDDRPQVAAHHRGLDAEALLAVERAVVDSDGQAFFIGEP